MDHPIAFTPSVETREPDEDKTIGELIDTLLKISATTYKDGHHALRSVHAKSHAILSGTLSVLPNIPPELAQGVFATVASYPVIVRMSSSPGDLLDDSVSTPRGVAVKIIGVPGARLPGSEGDTTQDFIMINGPVFAAPNAKRFLGSLKLLAGTTDKVPALKSVLSATLRGAERVLESVGGQSGALKSLGGEPATNPLGETYYTQVPMRYGEYMAKLSLAPISDALTRLKGSPVAITKSANALRETIQDFFGSSGGIWELRVQLCRDLEKMPIEDASVRWPEDLSPYVAVAHISIPQQNSWTQSRAAIVDDRTSFNPWHGTVDHQPLGSVMRARRAAYAASVKFRAEHNSVEIAEPREGTLRT
jgi:hypothetical protein